MVLFLPPGVAGRAKLRVIRDAVRSYLDGPDQAAGKRRPRTLSHHYRAALRAFVDWGSIVGDCETTQLRGVKGFNVEEDLATRGAVLRMINWPSDPRLPQSVRYDSICPARIEWSHTGWQRDRFSESTKLRSLTPSPSDWEGPEPCVVLRASVTKNRRAVEQPIPMPAKDLTVWLRDKPPEVCVTAPPGNLEEIHGRSAEAGIPYTTDEGVATPFASSLFVMPLVLGGEH